MATTTTKTMQTMVKTPRTFRVKGQAASLQTDIHTHKLDYCEFKLVKVSKWGKFSTTLATLYGDVSLTFMVNSLIQLAYELEKYRGGRQLESNFVIIQGRKVIATCTKGCVKGKMEWEFDTRFMSFIAR